MNLSILAALLATACITMPAQAADLTAPINCGSCAEWNQPQEPFNIAANVWYVGPQGLSVLLITGPKGHILLDGALPQSAPLIVANMKKLGFRIEDVKLIVNSHGHFDHAGGIAALQMLSGAKVVASVHGAQVLRDGKISPDDPQFDPDDAQAMPPTRTARGVKDGETLSVGPLKITAHLTPGHTPGSTTWSWVSCGKAEGCLNMVYADSITAFSHDGFNFTGPRAEQFRHSINKLGALKCDVIVSTHPSATDTFERLQARTPAKNTFIDPNGCRAYADGALKRLDERLASEKKATAAH